MHQKKILAVDIADTLREKILSGELVPGARLTESALARAYATSRTPIREALSLLDGEGLVKILPFKGATVSRISDKDIRNYSEIHGLLLSYVAEKVAKKIPDSAIAEMERLIDKLKAQFETKYYSGMVQTHNALYERFLKYCGNERLAAMVKAVTSPQQRFRVIMSQTESIDDCLDYYKEIIDAFRKKDSRKAAYHAARYAGVTAVSIRRRVHEKATKNKNGTKPQH